MTTPRANKSTAPEDPVEGAQPPSPTTTPAVAETAVAALAALTIHSTPLRISTSHVDPHSSDPADSKSQHTRLKEEGKHMPSQSSVNSDASNMAAKVDAKTMEAIIKNELHGSVFLYEGFWDDFLPDVESTLNDMQQRISGKLLQFKKTRWSFDQKPYKRGSETHVYEPVAKLLDTIGRAAHEFCRQRGSDQFRSRYRPFSDHHDKVTRADYPSDTHTKPDLVKAERPDENGAHWGDVETVVECKSHGKQTDQNEAYLQLARYARAIFSHQIYRLHVFGIAVCGSLVSFVRFDRSGLLHSPNINISTADGADLFVRKVISLLTLPAKDFGYDTRYTFRPDPSGQYLETLFALDGHSPRVVEHLLCHRKCCRGRATIASCLAAAKARHGSGPSTTSLDAADTSESPGDATDVDESIKAERFLELEIIHKGLWRNHDRTDEGVTAKRFDGVFGACQVIGSTSGDHAYTTEVKFPHLIKHSDAASRFVPTRVPPPGTETETETSTRTTSLSTVSNAETHAPLDVPDKATESDDETVETETSQTEASEQPSSATSVAEAADAPEPTDRVPREVRFKSDILMPKGRPLSEAQHPLHLLCAIHDALLGIAAYAEAGMVHCDISAYNILLVDPKIHYMASGGWNKSVKGSLGDLIWNCTGSEPLPPTPEGTMETTEPSRSPREKYVENLKRGPLGVSSDAEFSIKERRPPSEVHRDRTGTPAFISAQLLTDPPVGQPSVARTFIHDIESLLWVLIWMTAHHEPSKMNINAREFIQELSQYDLRKLGKFKLSTIKAYEDLDSSIINFDNSWSEDLAPVIQELAEFLYHFLYATEPTTKKQLKYSTMVAAFQKHRELMSLTRWDVFSHVLGILAESIEGLTKKYQLDPERL
ncbi:hypothetical protein FRC08_000575 [Ceratobasidium sp. 394]|nr:hypothetical protein FRC08_000575 [Ceratobasidium sp. 394]